MTDKSASANHAFDKAIALTKDGDSFSGHPSADYQNMVGPFGGITAAKVLNAILIHSDAEGSPVSITVNFLGPIKDEAVTLKPKLTRNNRTNQHWSIELIQGDEIQCTALIVLAKRFDTFESEEIPFPEAPAAESLEPVSSDLTPVWVKQYDMRFVYGNMLTMDEPETPSESLVWMSDSPARKLDFQSITSICDAFFPRLFLRTRKFSPAGTVTFTVYFHVCAEELAKQQSPRVLGHARATKFSGSYFDQRGEIWGEDKTLLATTSQLVYYKD
jgi:acyl-Coa thioesterase superfamily protein/acyl-CoA thioesterase superfamily protein